MSGELTWRTLEFAELSTTQLYAILKLRQDVFVIEQSCFYEDIDNADLHASHMLVLDASESLLGYQRIFAAGRQCDEASIGRVVISDIARGRGLGEELVRRGVQLCLERYPESGLRIEAQAHLAEFYCRVGFEAITEPKDVDGIPHIDMLYRGAPS